LEVEWESNEGSIVERKRSSSSLNGITGENSAVRRGSRRDEVVNDEDGSDRFAGVSLVLVLSGVRFGGGVEPEDGASVVRRAYGLMNVFLSILRFFTACEDSAYRG
jgi:hypothetical protein